MGLSHVVEAVVAVEDVPACVDFHTAALDLVVLSEHADGSVTLGAPPGETGRVRLRRTGASPGSIVWDPRTWDLGPGLLGMYSASLPDTVARIRAAGGSSCDPIRYPYGDSELREIVARVPGGLYWTIPQVPDPTAQPRAGRGPDAGARRAPHGSVGGRRPRRRGGLLPRRRIGCAVRQPARWRTVRDPGGDAGRERAAAHVPDRSRPDTWAGGDHVVHGGGRTSGSDRRAERVAPAGVRRDECIGHPDHAHRGRRLTTCGRRAARTRRHRNRARRAGRKGPRPRRGSGYCVTTGPDTSAADEGDHL